MRRVVGVRQEQLVEAGGPLVQQSEAVTSFGDGEVRLDAGKRKQLWAEAQRLYATELPSLPLFFRSDTFILPKWLSGVRPTGNQYPTTLSITDWAVQQ